MRYPHNIEGSKYGEPYRIGYDGNGHAYRILGDRRHGYTARPSVISAPSWTTFRTATLAEMGAALAGHRSPTAPATPALVAAADQSST